LAGRFDISQQTVRTFKEIVHCFHDALHVFEIDWLVRLSVEKNDQLICVEKPSQNSASDDQ
jgi:hypothetical protein